MQINRIYAKLRRNLRIAADLAKLLHFSWSALKWAWECLR